MSAKSFLRLINNYENISKLGREIIKHKEIISTIPKSEIDIEFIKQENRIQKFSDAIEKTNNEWKNNPELVNPYWTGLS
jgi:hypothetical protein